MAAAAQNGAQAAQELPGIPVDGEFYSADDLTGSEQRELRRVLRELTGNEDATLAQFLTFGLIDDFDLACGMTYVVRRRANASYTLDEALELKPAEIAAEGEALAKEKKRRPRKAASGGS